MRLHEGKHLLWAEVLQATVTGDPQPTVTNQGLAGDSDRALAGDSDRGLAGDGGGCRREDSQATAAADSQATMSDVAAEDLQATVAKDSQAKAAGVAAKDALDLHVTMAAVSLPSSSTQRRSCSRSPSSRDSSLLSMFSTHAAGLHSLSLVCKDQTSQHLASTLPSSVFVGGATGCGVLRASGGLYTLHGSKRTQSRARREGC